ncbi:MAG: hypothetical protein GX294_03510 [Candidatus Cloacimonetes bacterium]|nr:hypothetical protein [Candidatus Cloacimonadota bacterium]
MKKLCLIGILSVMCFAFLFAEPDYTMIDPLSLPTYSGSLYEPSVKVVYEDASGKYILVEVNGKLHAYYI